MKFDSFVIYGGSTYNFSTFTPGPEGVINVEPDELIIILVHHGNYAIHTYHNRSTTTQQPNYYYQAGTTYSKVFSGYNDSFLGFLLNYNGETIQTYNVGRDPVGTMNPTECIYDGTLFEFIL